MNADQNSKKVFRKRRIIVILSCFFVIAVLIGSGVAYFFHSMKPMQVANKKEKLITIPSGATTQDIGKILEKEGLIRHAWLFKYYVKYEHVNGFIAGSYFLSPSMTSRQIISDIHQGKQKYKYVLTIPEGLWLKDIAPKIAQITGESSEQILHLMSDKTYIKTHYMTKYPFLSQDILQKGIKYPLEGYLFPATYRFQKDNVTLDDVINKMLSASKSVYEPYIDQIKKSDLGSLHKALTLASVVEAEAGDYKAQQQISSVFENRIKKNMHLQSDVTVAYAFQEHLNRVFYHQLEIESPYNTYHVKGLPIGPINNPSENSLKAVLNPVNTKALFFYARPNGQILFANSYKDHEAIVNKYKHEWESQ
ncbi:endolytic transglycosylase MltG [Terrilactibacillus tamarindi]|uniref:endolytic transglycosylase MltG n=1 Tax=Terrilactibacillus tamarindi TaxID=2599694 RepID=UPI0018AD22C9|nr:endolytic transglycosylase MltG [Terrilactibacillus tamarindi]